MRARSRSGGEARPCVVLIDVEHWDGFQRIAPALRRNGVDVVRVRPAPPRSGMPGRVVERLIFGRARGLPEASRDASPGWEQILTTGVADVQGPEQELKNLREKYAWPTSMIARRVRDDDMVHLLFDKFAMSQFAAEHGIPTPDFWAEPPEGHFPIVVKGTTGSGGQSVRVVHDAAQLDEARATLEGRGERVFYQEYEGGDGVIFGGVANDGVLLVGGTVRMKAAADDPLGPGVEVEVLDRPDVVAEMGRLVAALGYTGIVATDLIDRKDGSTVLIDFNPRIFGSWLAMQQAGIDILGAYLTLLGVPSEITGRSIGTPKSIRIRHVPANEIGDWTTWRVEGKESLRAVRDAGAVTGPTYTSIGILRILARQSASALRLARSRT